MPWAEKECIMIEMSLPFASAFPSPSPSAESNHYTPPQIAAAHEFSEMSTVMDPFYFFDAPTALSNGSDSNDFRAPLFSANLSEIAASYSYAQQHKHVQQQQAEYMVHQPQIADSGGSSPNELTKTDAGAGACNNVRNARDKSNLSLIKLKRRAQNRAAQQTYRDRRAKHVKDLETKLANLQAAQEDALVENHRLRREVRDLSSEIGILRAASTKAKGDLGSDATKSSTAAGGISAPAQNGLTDLTSDNRQRHDRDHPYCGRTASIPADRLLQPGSTWDFIVSHDLFQRRLVDVCRVTQLLVGCARRDGHCYGFPMAEIVNAMEQSMKASSDDLL